MTGLLLLSDLDFLSPAEGLRLPRILPSFWSRLDWRSSRVIGLRLSRPRTSRRFSGLRLLVRTTPRTVAGLRLCRDLDGRSSLCLSRSLFVLTSSLLLRSSRTRSLLSSLSLSRSLSRSLSLSLCLTLSTIRSLDPLSLTRSIILSLDPLSLDPLSLSLLVTSIPALRLRLIMLERPRWDESLGERLGDLMGDLSSR